MSYVSSLGSDELSLRSTYFFPLTTDGNLVGNKIAKQISTLTYMNPMNLNMKLST